MGRKALFSKKMAESREAAKILVQRNRMGPVHWGELSSKPRFIRKWKLKRKQKKKRKKSVTKPREMSLKKTEVVRKARSYRKIYEDWKQVITRGSYEASGDQQKTRFEKVSDDNMINRKKAEAVCTACFQRHLGEVSFRFFVWNTRTCGFKNTRESDNTNCP